jgi:hypothetical protein
VPTGNVLPQAPPLALQSIPAGEDVTVPSIPPSKLTTKARLFWSTGSESSPPPPQADKATNKRLIRARRIENSEKMELKICLLSILLAGFAPTCRMLPCGSPALFPSVTWVSLLCAAAFRHPGPWVFSNSGDGFHRFQNRIANRNLHLSASTCSVTATTLAPACWFRSDTDIRVFPRRKLRRV